jgi:hypothetical protein
MTSRRHTPYQLPGSADLFMLAGWRAPVVSLFVPVTASVPDVTQNRVRHARVVAQAISRLNELGVDPQATGIAERQLAFFSDEQTAPAPSVKTRVAFWSLDGVRTFGLSFSEPERSLVSRSAAIRPIVRAAQRPSHYRVLVLSVNQVALHEGDAGGLEPVHDVGLPKSLEAALGSHLTAPVLQHHSGGDRGDRAVYHGQGGATRGRQVDLRRFHQCVARALEAELAHDPVPLVLAADVSHRHGLETALRCNVGLLPEGLVGNPENLSQSGLHAATWPLVEKIGPDPESELERSRGAGTLITGLDEVVRAEVMRRVRRLWVPAARCIPGCVDADRAPTPTAWADDDLLDDLATSVIRRGGHVFVPERQDVDLEEPAAELRW